MDYKLKDTLSKDAFRYGYLINKIFPFIKPHMGRIILNMILAVPLGLLDSVVAFALKPYMDCVINGKPWHLFGFTIEQSLLATVIPFGIILFAVVQGLLKYTNNYLTDWIGNKISNSLKVELFRKLTSLDPKFYDINSSGLVLTRFFTDPETASKNIINMIKSFIMTSFGIVGLVGVLLYNSWKLAIIGVGIMAIAITPVTLIRKRIKKVSNATMVVGGDMTTNFNETFAGNKIMTAYNLQKLQNEKFEHQIKEQFNLTISLTKRVGWMSPIMYFICSIGIALVMFYGNHLIISGQMTAGSFASFVTSLLLLYKPVKDLGRTLTDLQTTFVALGRVFELFDLVPNIKNRNNAIKMLNLLREAGIKTSLEAEEVGTFEDSMCAVIIAGLMHDLGMMIGRQGHEDMSAIFAQPIIERALMHVFPNDLKRRVIIKSLATEAIVGHMSSKKIHSIEAGIILIADGCDMTKGRARIPMAINTTPRVGDIHKYSANAINRIGIHHGHIRPIRIDIEMSGDVGFFQIEEVLLTKIDSSPAKQFVELYAGVEGQEKKRYL